MSPRVMDSTPSINSEAHRTITMAPCPFCGADRGAACETAEGKLTWMPHQGRVHVRVAQLLAELT